MNRLVLALALLALPACKPARAPEPSLLARHLVLRRIAGDAQVAPVGSALHDPFVVGVVDDQGLAIGGVTIAWSSYMRGGELRTVLDDRSGVANVFWVVEARGPQTVTASVWSGGAASPITFTVYGQ